MHNKTYMRSKIPLPLVLLFILNLLVVITLEILLLYPAPVPLTAEALASHSSTYAGCTITASADMGKLYCYLVETADGQIHLVPTHGHGLAYKRAKILKKQIAIIPEDPESTIPVKTGLHTSLVTVRTEPLSSTPYLEIDFYGSGGQSAVTIYMVIAAVLEALELSLWHLLTKQ